MHTVPALIERPSNGQCAGAPPPKIFNEESNRD